jgi:DNA polymerase I
MMPGGAAPLWEADDWCRSTFRECWVINFEFSQPPGENPAARCFTAIEKFSGRIIKLGRAELIKLKKCPFDIGRDVLVCAYAVVAEIACFLSLGWSLPCNVLCLYAEHRVTTNGHILPFSGNGLSDALACRGSAHLSDKAYQDRMNKRAQDPTPFTTAEEAAIVEHCFYNTQAALRLLDVMAPTIKWQRARFMGRFSADVARIERRGTPLAMGPVRCLIDNRKRFVQDLVAAVDAHLGVYEGITYKRDRMKDLIERRGWEGWPPQPDGIWPAVNKEVLKMMEDLYPGEEGEEGTIADFRQLRATVSQFRDIKLAIGRDGRNRTALLPFATKTGRCAPSTTEYIWGVAKWMRRLIQPGPGMALGYLDFSAEEFLVSACLSGDDRMQQAYYDGDPYMGVGIALGLAPRDATGDSHPAVRSLMKVLLLGLGYGMKEHGLQKRTGLSLAESRDIMRLHKKVFYRFWEWIDAWQAEAWASRLMTTPLGWEMRLRGKIENNMVQNWPSQSTAADIMRLFTVAAEDAGVTTCALIHDAGLVEAPEEYIEETVAEMGDLMVRAGRTVIGADLRVGKPQIVRHHQRFYDKDGEPLYRKVTALLPEIAA